MHIIAITSGGMDSAVMVTHFLHLGHTVDTISFDYGQRHRKELQFAALFASSCGLRHDLVDLTRLRYLLAESGSSLVSDTEVPEGHYAQENMKKTVVPNRNMIMLSIAGGIAVAREAGSVGIGVHAGDHFIYPDCRPEFIANANNTLRVGNEGFASPTIWAPFINRTKADIALEGFQLGIDFSQTWSCYKGGDKHCGRCGTCVERLEAIAEACDKMAGTATDTTQYEDRDFWKGVTK